MKLHLPKALIAVVLAAGVLSAQAAETAYTDFSGVQTLTEDTTITGITGVASGVEINGGEYNVSLKAATATTQVDGFLPTMTNTGELTIAQGGFTSTKAEDLAGVQSIVVDGGRLRFTGSQTLSQNVSIGHSTFFVSSSGITNSALLISADVTLNNPLTVLSTSTGTETSNSASINYEGKNSSKLTINGLTGRGNILIGGDNQASNRVLNVTGGSDSYTGVFSFYWNSERVTVTSGANGLHLGGLQDNGNSYGVFGVASGSTSTTLTLDVAENEAYKSASRFNSGVELVKKGAGTQTLTSSIDNKVTVEAGTLVLENGAKNVELSGGTLQLTSGKTVDSVTASGATAVDGKTTLTTNGATVRKLAVNGGTLVLGSDLGIGYSDLSMAEGASIETTADAQLVSDAVTYSAGATITADKALTNLSAYNGGFTVSGGDIAIASSDANSNRYIAVGIDGSNVTTTLKGTTRFTQDVTIGDFTNNSGTTIFDKKTAINGEASFSGNVTFSGATTLGGEISVDGTSQMLVADSATVETDTLVTLGESASFKVKDGATLTLNSNSYVATASGTVIGVLDDSSLVNPIAAPTTDPSELGPGGVEVTVTPAATATIQNATITSNAITGDRTAQGVALGKMDGARIQVANDLSISYMDITNSGIDVNADNVTLTLHDVTISEKSVSVTGENSHVKYTGCLRVNLTESALGLIDYTGETPTLVLDGALTKDVTELMLIYTEDFINNLQFAHVGNPMPELLVKFDGDMSGLSGADSVTVYNPTGFPATTVASLDTANSSLLLQFTPAIPEPATATLGLLALAGLAARRRRKH